MVTTFLSVSSLAPVAPLNPAYTAEEFARYLRISGAPFSLPWTDMNRQYSPLQGNSGSGPSGSLLPGYAGDFSVQPCPDPVIQKNDHPTPEDSPAPSYLRNHGKTKNCSPPSPEYPFIDSYDCTIPSPYSTRQDSCDNAPFPCPWSCRLRTVDPCIRRISYHSPEI